MKKKILIIITSLFIGGGAERAVSILSQKLSISYEINILTFYHYKNLYPFKGIYFSLKENQNSWKKILIPLKIYKCIKEISPDLIISFMDHTNMIVILSKLLYRIKIPLIVSIRANPLLIYKNSSRYYNILIRIFYRLKIVDKIIINSKYIKDILEQHYKISRKKLKTIYNGIDIQSIKKLLKFKVEDYSDIFQESKYIKFINVGRLSESKNQEFLITAFSRVHKELNNSKLIIIGEGPLKSYLHNLIKKLYLQNSVLLIGLRRNPFKYLAKTDIFILSSSYEGMPNVLIEAMACGCSIISTDLKVSNEILANGKFGLLVGLDDIDDLVEKMLLLGKNVSLRKEISENSYKRVKYYDYNKISKEWCDIINLTLILEF